LEAAQISFESPDNAAPRHLGTGRHDDSISGIDLGLGEKVAVSSIPGA
jgi:hypothetical protein